MGELEITICDLGICQSCGHDQAMIFKTSKEKWWVACGFGKCEHKTKEHVELLDAASEWGLKEMKQ